MNLNNVRTGELKNVFDALEEAFKATGTDYYMIGAIARDIKDVDFAALVGSQAEYEEIRTYLQEHKQFRVSPTNIE